MSLDRIPGDADLYIGGLISLRRYEALKKANITHVVSALRLPLDEDLFRPYQHHVVEIDDDDDENIIQHFPASNAFIEEGLARGGGVLVHCAMGKSRSTTILIAYILSWSVSLMGETRTQPLEPREEAIRPFRTLHTPTSALDLIRQVRSFAEPNPGFMAQLELYSRMGCPKDLDSHPEYQRWLYQRAVEESNSRGVAPGIEDIRFEDEAEASRKQQEDVENTSTSRSFNPTTLSPPPSTSSTTSDSENTPSSPKRTYRCRRCRTPLATTAFTVPHSPSTSSPSGSSIGHQNPPPQSSCAHIFLQPLNWMRPELGLGHLSGRLECPNGKCRTQIGRYAWQGVKCSCGQWVVPGLGLARGKVDEVIDRGLPGVGGRGRI